MFDKLLKALGSVFVIGLVTSVIANVIGLQLEYNYYIPESEKPNLTRPQKEDPPTSPFGQKGQSETSPSKMSPGAFGEQIKDNDSIGTFSPSHVTLPNVQDRREIKIVSPKFAYSQHHWFVKIMGFAIALFPFFYTPMPRELKDQVELTRLIIRESRNYYQRREALNSYLIFILIYWGIYFVLFLLSVFLLGRYLGLDFCNYTILIYERILNYFVGLI